MQCGGIRDTRYSAPLISVVMSVHNGERFLRESIESILNQSFADFEFIIIDDGSTDSSGEIIREYADGDRRIVAIYREQKGLTKSLNEGLTKARGIYIARQDADDISLPHRFATMIRFMEQNPSISVAGSWCEKINEAGNVIGWVKHPLNHDRICWAMMGYSAITHPSAVIRRVCFARFGGYNENYIYAQDYELWTRWIRLGARLANLPDLLIKYRVSDQQVTGRFSALQSESAVDSATIYINFLLSDTLRRREILGIRQLVWWLRIDADAVYAIPVLLRLLRLQRFWPWMGYAWLTRSRLAVRVATAIEKFGGGYRRRALWYLVITLLISPYAILTKIWWVALSKRVLH